MVVVEGKERKKLLFQVQVRTARKEREEYEK